jgi:hypothetical protein
MSLNFYSPLAALPRILADRASEEPADAEC